MKTEALLNRLNKYDEKYRDAINKSNGIGFGYGMRAYHRLKTMNPPEWKIKEKAEEIKNILDERGVKYHTYWV